MATYEERLALPPELLVAVLEYLTDRELWIVARVSRQFYASVWPAGLFIHRKIAWIPVGDYSPQCSEFKAVVEHVKRKDLRLSFSLWASFNDERNINRSFYGYGAFDYVLDSVLPLIVTALPYLVYLAIELPDHFRPPLDAALRCPAPRLRTFKLTRTMDQVPCMLPVPKDLFAGFAPLLRTLELGTIPLTDEDPPVFQSLTDVTLASSHLLEDIAINRQFPCLTSLCVKSTGVAPESFDLSGLAIRTLTIDNWEGESLLDAFARSVDRSTIPNIKVIAGDVQMDEPLWTTDSATLSMRLSEFIEDIDDTVVSITPAHRRWRRSYRLTSWPTDLPPPIADIPNIGARLTYLRADLSVLEEFWALDLTLAALREFQIDVLSSDEHADPGPPDYDDFTQLQSFELATNSAPRMWVPCPALATFTLFALDKPIPGADARRIAFIVHALSPRAEDKPVLVLCGLEFGEPAEHALLDQTVSDVRVRPFAGRGSREDYDDGLWDLDF